MHFTFKLRDQLEGNCPSTYNKGGGGSSTTTSGMPEEFRPYVEEGLKTAEGMYKKEMAAGAQPTVDAYTRLGTTGAALGAEAEQERKNLAQFKTEGAGATAARDEYGRQMGQDWNQMIQQDLQKTAASGAMGMSNAGALGSARAGMAQQGALADRAMQLRAAENAAKTQAAQGLAGADTSAQQRYLSGLEAGQALGEQQYKGAQAGVTSAEGVSDAPYRALDRFFGYLGSPALGSESKQTQSGGGK
jgi:hypothetical protein